MSEKDDLIVEQQLEIRKLKYILEQYTNNLNKINGVLFCVGGPLNDRWHHYNKKVEDSFIEGGYYLAKPLNEISTLCYTYTDEEIKDFVVPSKKKDSNIGE
jgi:hypothetical protein